MSVFKLCAFADEADPSMSGQIDALHGNGIEFLEVRGVDGKNVTKLTTAEMKELRTRLDGEGIKIWSIGSPIGKVEIEGDFEAHLELFKHTLELANIAGAEKMRIFSFFMSPEDAPKYKNKVIEQLGRMVEAAKGTGVVLCHENEKDIYGDIPERCVEIHKALPQIAGVFDPANYVQCGQDTWHCWELVHPYIKYMHIKDARKDGFVVPAGHGEGQVARLLEAYGAQGGEWLTIEPHLTLFSGLAALEREGEKSQVGEHVYETADAAFDAACDALKKIL